MKRITLVKRKLSITYDIKWKGISFTLETHTHRQNGKHRCEAAFTDRV